MPDVTLSAGALSYEDSGGDGPVVVMVGGLAMDALMWRKVVAELSPAHRCLVLTLPLGSHRQPMKPDSDLSTRGLARLGGSSSSRSTCAMSRWWATNPTPSRAQRSRG